MTPILHISVAGEAGSKFTTSGAINSGVPNRIRRSPVGSNFRAKPKSMILMIFPSRVRHRIFSGCKRKKVFYLSRMYTLETEILALQ